MQLFSTYCLTACSSTYNLPNPPNIYSNQTPYASLNIEPEKQSAQSNILYVTDRQPETSKDGELEFGHTRSPIIRYGTGKVELGENQTWDDIVAAANSDVKRVKLAETLQGILPEAEFPPTPYFFTADSGVIKIDPEQSRELEAARADFKTFVRGELSKSTKKDVVVFIHGFKTSFEEALFVTNDIYHYSGRTGVPIAYTWPSNDGSILGYFSDRASADFTIYHLKELFRNLMDMPEIDNIHVVAHSLGTQVTTTALRELLIETRASGENPKERFNIENLIMAAPDLDYGVVTQRLIAEQFASGFGRITVYTNPKDRALSLSGLLQASLRFGKLLPSEEGSKEKEIFENVRNVSFIKVNAHTPGFTNHGYLTKNPSTLSDVVTLINTPSDPGTPARPLENLDGNFWSMGEGYLKAPVEPLLATN